MRSDMAKKLVERPRHNAGDPNWAGRGARRAARVAVQRGDDAALPTRQPCRPRARTKWLNENLAPLKRFLRSRIGRPWDAVYSELRAHVRADNTVQAHIMEHLYQCVHRVVTREPDGAITDWSDGAPRPLYANPWWPALYVDPADGCLREARAPRPTGSAYLPRRVRRGDVLYVRWAGHWHRVTVAERPLNAVGKPPVDALTGEPVRREQADRREALYGLPVRYAVSATRLTPTQRQRLRLPVPRRRPRGIP